MNRHNGLGKLYDRLTPGERFRLDMEARARGDEGESRRLVSTCPRQTYTQNEDTFVSRCDTVREITLVLCIDLTGRLSRLATVKAFGEVLPYGRTVFINETYAAYLDGHEAGSRSAWRRAGKEENPSGWEPTDDDYHDEDEEDPTIEKALDDWERRLEEVDIMPKLLGRLERKLAEEAAAIWQAYSRFCREELSLEPEKLVKVWMEPALAAIEAHGEALQNSNPEERDVEEYRQALKGLWERAVSNGAA